MDPIAALALLTNAVSLLQGVTALTNAYDEVSKIIAKRLAENRPAWTPAERQAIMDAVEAARKSAVDEVNKLP